MAGTNSNRAAVLLIGLSLAILTTWTAAADDTVGEETGDLAITISGADADLGTIAVRLWEGGEHWLERRADNPDVVRTAQAVVRDGAATVFFAALPYGNYAVTAYHDANDNGELDLGLFRMPKERLGFSNGVHPKFKAPAYTEAAFAVRAPVTRIAIELRRVP